MGKSSIDIDLSELERRLGASVPHAYREFVERENPKSLAVRGFDPKTLLVLNLELRESDREGHTRGRFFLNTDGCGNYYFVELHPATGDVLLWSHDPPGIEDQHRNLDAYLREAEQEYRIDFPIAEGDLCICRTSVWRESILNPIPLDQWIAAVRSISELEYLGYRDGQNPFTGKVFRVEWPGFTRVRGSENEHILFSCGRAKMSATSLLRPSQQPSPRSSRPMS